MEGEEREGSHRVRLQQHVSNIVFGYGDLGDDENIREKNREENYLECCLVGKGWGVGFLWGSSIKSLG